MTKTIILGTTNQLNIWQNYYLERRPLKAPIHVSHVSHFIGFVHSWQNEGQQKVQRGLKRSNRIFFSSTRIDWWTSASLVEFFIILLLIPQNIPFSLILQELYFEIPMKPLPLMSSSYLWIHWVALWWVFLVIGPSGHSLVNFSLKRCLKWVAIALEMTVI